MSVVSSLFAWAPCCAFVVYLIASETSAAPATEEPPAWDTPPFRFVLEGGLDRGPVIWPGDATEAIATLDSASQEKFKTLWARYEKAEQGRKLAWRRAFSEDPAFAKAVAALRHTDEGENKVHDLQRMLRDSYADKDPSELTRVEWWCELVPGLEFESWFNNLVADKDYREIVQWILMFENQRFFRIFFPEDRPEDRPVRKMLSDEGEKLTAHRALEIFLIGLKHRQVSISKETAPERAKIEQTTAIPDIAREYVAQGMEIHLKFLFCEPYAVRHLPPYIAEAEREHDQAILDLGHSLPGLFPALEKIMTEREVRVRQFFRALEKSGVVPFVGEVIAVVQRFVSSLSSSADAAAKTNSQPR